jgi:RHS repeat-associated protein
MSWTYDPVFNLPTSIEDFNGHTTIIDLDPDAGNVLRVTYPEGAVTDITYNAGGDPLSVTTGTHVVDYEYAGGVYLTSITGPDGRTTHYSFDAAGRPLSKTDPLGHQETYVYDDLDYLERVTNHLGQSFSYERDLLGRMTAFVDPLGNRQENTLDAAGRLVAMTDREGNLHRWEYDGTGAAPQGDRPTAMIDPLGQVTSYEYDFQGRITRRIDPAGAELRYSYDGRGDLAEITTARGESITYSYDAAERLVEEDDGTTVTTYGYDANGRLTSADNGVTALTLTYDTDDRLTSVHDSLTGRTVSYTWDDLDRRTSLTLSGEAAIQYRYEARGLLEEVEGGPFGLTQFVWDGAERLSTIEHPNGVTTSYAYDEVDRITSIEHRDPASAVLERFDAGYDARGRRTSVTDGDGIHEYTYDREDRVVRATHPLIPDEEYVYDAAGRRVSSAANGALIYGAGNRLLRDGVRSWEYDAVGNVTARSGSGGRLAFSYDPRGRLTGVTLPDGRDLTYRYDPLGRIVERDLDGQITRYVYDGLAVLAELDGGNVIQRRYLRTDGLDGLLAVAREGTTYRYHLDHQGTVALLTDASGAVAQSFRYTVFGARVEASDPSFDEPYGFTGRRLDPDTGLYDYRVRWYDAEAGRFLTRDPLGSIDGPDPYTYVRNDPLNLVDPFGLGSIRRRPLGSAWIYVLVPAHLFKGDLHHAHIFLDDGTDYGFMGNGKVESDDDAPQWAKDLYQDVHTDLDDDLLREAVMELRDQFEEDGYDVRGEKYGAPDDKKNCQDFADAVYERYQEKVREREREQQEERTKPEGK